MNELINFLKTLDPLSCFITLFLIAVFVVGSIALYRSKIKEEE